MSLHIPVLKQNSTPFDKIDKKKPDHHCGGRAYYCKHYKPSSVPPRGPLSFIYDCGHPQPLATYPPTLGEQPLIVGIRGLATRKAYGQTTLLPLRWALTPPFHPYLPAEADIGGYSLLRYYTLTDIEPLTRAVLCVARTFLPLTSRQR